LALKFFTGAFDMFKRTISRFSLGIFLLTSTILSYAVTCPPVEVIKKSALKIDADTVLDNGYFVKSSKTAFKANGLNWYVGIDGITASSSANAIQIGKEKIQNADSSLQNVAIYVSKGSFRCSYRPGNIIVVGMK
jgi:hypothetical protein